MLYPNTFSLTNHCLIIKVLLVFSGLQNPFDNETLRQQNQVLIFHQGTKSTSYVTPRVHQGGIYPPGHQRTLPWWQPELLDHLYLSHFPRHTAQANRWEPSNSTSLGCRKENSRNLRKLWILTRPKHLWINNHHPSIKYISSSALSAKNYSAEQTAEMPGLGSPWIISQGTG